MENLFENSENLFENSNNFFDLNLDPIMDIFMYIPLRCIYRDNHNCINKNSRYMILKTIDKRKNIKLEMLGRYSVSFYNDVHTNNNITFDFSGLKLQKHCNVYSFNLIRKLVNEQKLENLSPDLIQNAIKKSQIKLIKTLIPLIDSINNVKKLVVPAINSGNITTVKLVLNRMLKIDSDYSSRYFYIPYFIIQNKVNTELCKYLINFILKYNQLSYNVVFKQYINISINVDNIDLLIFMLNLRKHYYCKVSKKLANKICNYLVDKHKYYSIIIDLLDSTQIDLMFLKIMLVYNNHNDMSLIYKHKLRIFTIIKQNSDEIIKFVAKNYNKMNNLILKMFIFMYQHLYLFEFFDIIIDIILKKKYWDLLHYLVRQDQKIKQLIRIYLCKNGYHQVLTMIL